METLGVSLSGMSRHRIFMKGLAINCKSPHSRSALLKDGIKDGILLWGEADVTTLLLTKQGYHNMTRSYCPKSNSLVGLSCGYLPQFFAEIDISSELVSAN